MRAWFVMLTADGSERPFGVHRSPTSVGRAAQCDLRVPIPSVKPRHCELRLVEGSGWEITTTSPEAAVLVNGRETHQAMLSCGDRVTIGPVNFVIRYAAQGQSDYDAITETKPVALPKPGAARATQAAAGQRSAGARDPDGSTG